MQGVVTLAWWRGHVCPHSQVVTLRVTEWVQHGRQVRHVGREAGKREPGAGAGTGIRVHGLTRHSPHLSSSVGTWGGVGHQVTPAPSVVLCHAGVGVWVGEVGRTGALITVLHLHGGSGGH